MRRNGPPFDLAALPSAIALIFFVLLLTIPALSALLVDQNDTSAENTRIVTNLLSEGRTDDLNQEISATTDAPQEESNQTFLSGPFHQLTKEQWEQLTTPPNDQPLITEIPFKIAGRPSPRYAFITSNSYNQYLDHLNTLCRKTEDDDIAEIRLNSLDNDYFTWEEMAFNRAVIKRIFPETEQGDHSRYLNATRKLRKMHLRAEPESQCKTEKNEDTWSARVDERSQFEDFIINTIFRPHFDGAFAQRVLMEEEERLRTAGDHPQIQEIAETNVDRRVRRQTPARISTHERRRLERAARAEAEMFRAKRKFH